jgi:ABC-type multidrug transport system permease subunit
VSFFWFNPRLQFYINNDDVPLLHSYQVAFIFLLAQMEVMGLLQGVESTIEGRTIMKYEVSDRLYRDEAFIVSFFIVDLCTFLFFNIIYLVIAFALSGLSWSYFGTFYGWSLAALLVFQSYFQMVAATAKSTADATTKALPGMILFILFNGKKVI